MQTWNPLEPTVADPRTARKYANAIHGAMRDGTTKAQRTKEAIAESYRRLLSEKPQSRITVAEIASGCGVTVPTFYNHFKDKHALAVWMYANDSTRIMGNIGVDGYEWRDTLLDGMRYFAENRGLVLNALVHVSGRTQFLSFMEENNIGLLMDEIRKSLGPGEEVPSDIAEMAKIYCIGTVRYVYDWLISDDPLPLDEVADIFEKSLPYKLRPYLLRSKAFPYF